jgi:hypothetical protein
MHCLVVDLREWFIVLPYDVLMVLLDLVWSVDRL